MHLNGLVRDLPNVTLGELYDNYGTIRDEAIALFERVDRLEKKYNLSNAQEVRIEEIPDIIRDIRDIVNMLR